LSEHLENTSRPVKAPDLQVAVWRTDEVFLSGSFYAVLA